MSQSVPYPNLERLHEEVRAQGAHIEIVTDLGKTMYARGKREESGYHPVTELRVTMGQSVLAREPLHYGLSSVDRAAELLLKAVP